MPSPAHGASGDETMVRTDTKSFSIGILSSEYNRFPEIGSFNPGFGEDTLKLKVSIEVDPRLAAKLLKAGKEFRAALLEVCPSLTDHQCRSDSDETEPLDPNDLGEICGRRMKDDPVDIAHLLEHMVIDLVVEISGTDRCSGVTCGLHDPKNRFHVYVECEDATVGEFAVRIAAKALTHLLHEGADPATFRRPVNLARWVVGRNGGLCSPPEIADALGWSETETTEAITELVDFGLLTREMPPVNFSDLPYFARGEVVRMAPETS